MTPEENDSAISGALLAKSDSDYTLAAALFENYRNEYYRLAGYRSVAEYLRERFKGSEQDAAARLHARSFQRLIREFKLSIEIPKFREAFDSIPRSTRRLIAQVLTPENAEEWIQRARTMTYRELEDLIAQKKIGPGMGMVVKRLKFFPDQWEIFERAMTAAGKILENEGRDPQEIGDGVRIEMLCQEFLGTYEGGGYKAISYFECPGCGKFAPMNRRPEQDVPDGDRKMIVFECRSCGAGLVTKAFA
jgi:hypothetical protein